MLRLVVGRASVKAHEMGADGSDVDFHDAKSIVELIDLRGELVTQAGHFPSQLLPQAGDFPVQLVPQAADFRSKFLPQLRSHRIHLVAKAMDVVAEP
ncbi:MAG: hypothetical protein OXU77_00280 [Gammaproteobacteria bacterium]|nr:hypothetical protein [Gammaproteobacteria bacterium]